MRRQCGNSWLSSQALNHVLSVSSWSAHPADCSGNLRIFNKWIWVTSNAKTFGVCNKKCPLQLKKVQHEHCPGCSPQSPLGSQVKRQLWALPHSPALWIWRHRGDQVATATMISGCHSDYSLSQILHGLPAQWLVVNCLHLQLTSN